MENGTGQEAFELSLKIGVIKELYRQGFLTPEQAAAAIRIFKQMDKEDKTAC